MTLHGGYDLHWKDMGNWAKKKQERTHGEICGKLVSISANTCKKICVFKWQGASLWASDWFFLGTGKAIFGEGCYPGVLYDTSLVIFQHFLSLFIFMPDAYCHILACVLGGGSSTFPLEFTLISILKLNFRPLRWIKRCNWKLKT